MRIGELATKAKVNIQTVRFYERQRILRTPSRTSGGYRSYETRDLEHLLFVKWCQRLGFTLKEVKELLPLHSALTGNSGSRSRRELQGIVKMAEEKLENIEEKITSLRKMSRQVAAALRELKKSPAPVCPASRPRPRPSAKPTTGDPRCSNS
jgi:MerR family mercuric resistance operon transcriptional regulator